MLFHNMHALGNEVVPYQFSKCDRTVLAAGAAKCDHQTALALLNVQRDQKSSRSLSFSSSVRDCSKDMTYSCTHFSQPV